MNSKQEKIFEVIKAILRIKNFPEMFKDHTISYGVLNYVAKYSLAKDKYLISKKALDNIKKKNIIKNQSLLRGSKSKKNGFTYEHPIPSNVISSELLKNRNDIDMISKILKWSDYIVVLTTQENLSLRNSGLERKMPADWTFFKNDPFERYKKAGLFQEDFSEINVYGQVVR